MAKSSKNKDTTPKSINVEIGRTSEVFYSGYGGNTDYNRALVGRGRIKEYDKMRLGDSTVAACYNAILLPILCANWHFEPASEDSFDIEVSNFVEDNIFNRMSRTWAEFLAEALVYLPHGNRVFEQVYEFSDDGKIRIKKFAHRPSESITDYKLKNGDLGVVQKTIKGEYEIPIWKLLILVNRKEGDNWEGQSVFRSAYRNYYVKDKLIQIDAIAAERQGLGVPMAEVPMGTYKNNRPMWDKTIELLENLRAHEKGYMIHETGTKSEFMDMKASTTRDVIKSITYHDRQIEKSILADFMSLGATATGSFALSDDKTSMFLLSLEAHTGYLCGVIDEYVTKRLVDFNFNVTNYPKLKFSGIRKEDISKLSTSISQLVTAGVLTPDDGLQDYLRTVMKLPEKTDLMSPDILTSFDDMFEEMDADFANLTGEGEEEEEEAPVEADDNTAIQSILGGAAGVPLSEETKRKISEALSKGGKKKKGAKKKKNPEIDKKRKEINELRKKIRDFQNDAKRKLLEMASKNEKVDKEKLAKMKLKLFDKKAEIDTQIDKLKGEIDTLKADETSQTAAYKTFAEGLEHDIKNEFITTIMELKEKVDRAIDGDDQTPTNQYKL